MDRCIKLPKPVDYLTNTMLRGGVQNKSVFTFAFVAAVRVDAASVVARVRLFYKKFEMFNSY